MLRAHADGPDVITMSLGGGGNWAELPTAAVASAIADAGVVVLTAAGNDDCAPFGVEEPATGPSVISVGSVDK